MQSCLITLYVKFYIQRNQTTLPFDSSSILKAFSLDMDAQYGEFNITNREAVEFMATSLQKTLG